MSFNYCSLSEGFKMEYFVDVDFFQTKCSFLVKHLYIVYSLCGAFYYENYIRFKFRLLLRVCSFVGYFSCTIPQILKLSQNPAHEDLFQVIGFTQFVHFCVLTSWTIHRKRKQFHRLFDLFEEHSRKPAMTVINRNPDDQDGDYFDQINMAKIHIFLYIFLSFAWFIGLSKLMLMFLNYNEDTPLQISPRHEFFIPFFCDSCNTRTSYILATIFSLIVPYVLLISHYGSMCLMFLASMNLKNQVVVLHNDIVYYSKLTGGQLEKCYGEEEEELTKSRQDSFKLREIGERKVKCVREFTLRIRHWIEMHQRLLELVNQYRACAEVVLDSQTANSWMNIIFLGYFLTAFVMDDEDGFYIWVSFAMASFAAAWVDCFMGHVLNELSDTISNAVYSTPWFYLPIEDQKIVLNFLTLSQRPQKLRVFGTISLNLELYPEILQKTYDYIQIMRLLVMRERR